MATIVDVPAGQKASRSGWGGISEAGIGAQAPGANVPTRLGPKRFNHGAEATARACVFGEQRWLEASAGDGGPRIRWLR
jgi:hypothetical protein